MSCLGKKAESTSKSPRRREKNIQNTFDQRERQQIRLRYARLSDTRPPNDGKAQKQVDDEQLCEYSALNQHRSGGLPCLKSTPTRSRSFCANGERAMKRLSTP